MTDPFDPQDEDARYARVELAYQEARFAHCAVLAQEFVAAYPRHGVGWALLGLAWMKLGRYREARRALDRAIKFVADDHRLMPYAWMGDLYARKGDHRKAAAWYRKVIDLAPEDPRGHLYLGMAMARAGQLPEAEAAFRAAILLAHPDDVEPRLQLALILRAQEQWDEALDLLEDIDADPFGSVRAESALADVRAVLKHRRAQTFRVIENTD